MNNHILIHNFTHIPVFTFDSLCISQQTKRIFFILRFWLHYKIFCLQKDIFKNICLELYSESQFSCFLPQPSLFSVKNYTDPVESECCLDGMKETPLSYTCEVRSEYIVDGQGCRDAFLRCCKAVETLRAEKREEDLKLARSKRWKQNGKGLSHSYYLS